MKRERSFHSIKIPLIYNKYDNEKALYRGREIIFQADVK